jgi:hypothetical protein
MAYSIDETSHVLPAITSSELLKQVSYALSVISQALFLENFRVLDNYDFFQKCTDIKNVGLIKIEEKQDQPQVLRLRLAQSARQTSLRMTDCRVIGQNP